MTENNLESQYKDCFVTFFDILGFSELLRSRSPTHIAEILSVFRALSINGEEPTAIANASFQPPANGTRIEIVSDAIVRVRPNRIDPLTKMSELFDEMIVLKEIQIGCLQKGILVRGATTLGSMYIDDDPSGPIFGPALAEAYQIESREVIYPRIAIHGDVVARFKHEKNPLLAESYQVDVEMLKLLLARDGAGLYFIDYLRVNFEDQNWSAAETFDFLRKHRSLIRDGLRNHHGSIRRKFSWLQNYHNTSIDHAIQRGIGSESYPEAGEVSASALHALKIDD
ncbi:MAG: hypothetical protein QNJ44_05050 [Rhodobacter sp.]|nr:hypothetical protein [Rhodobacter sp.]